MVLVKQFRLCIFINNGAFGHEPKGNEMFCFIVKFASKRLNFIESFAVFENDKHSFIFQSG